MNKNLKLARKLVGYIRLKHFGLKKLVTWICLNRWILVWSGLVPVKTHVDHKIMTWIHLLIWIFLSQVKIRLRIIKNVMLFFNKGQFNLFLKKVHGPLIKKGKFYAYILSACKIKPSWTQSWRIQSLPGNRILWRTISPMMQPTDQISTVGKEEETRAKGRKTEVGISTHTSSGMKKDVNDWCELCYSH